MWGLQRGAFPRWKARRGNGFLWNEIRSERNRGQRGMTHFQDDYRNQCKSWLKVKVVGEVNLWIRERGTEDPKKLNWGAKIYFTLEMYILPWKYLFHRGNIYLNCSTLALSATNWGWNTHLIENTFNYAERWGGEGGNKRWGNSWKISFKYYQRNIKRKYHTNMIKAWEQLDEKIAKNLCGI